jgi:hypothetical protein
MTEKQIADVRRDRLMNERAKYAYYTRYRCKYCGATPSIHCDEHTPGGPACTPCRRDQGL